MHEYDACTRHESQQKVLSPGEIGFATLGVPDGRMIFATSTSLMSSKIT
jgi:hypothetical protein